MTTGRINQVSYFIEPAQAAIATRCATKATTFTMIISSQKCQECHVPRGTTSHNQQQLAVHLHTTQIHAVNGQVKMRVISTR
jgi:hypothetical protein